MSLVQVQGVKCHAVTTEVLDELVTDGVMEVGKETTAEGQQLVLIFQQIRIVVPPTEPCLKTRLGTYIINSCGDFYGIIIPADTPESTVRKLEALLNAFTRGLIISEGADTRSCAISPATDSKDIVRRDPVKPPKVAEWIATGIEYSSEKVAEGLVKGAELIGSGMKKGSDFAQQRTTPRAEPTKVSEKTRTAIDRSKYVASSARETTTQVADVVEKSVQQLAEETVAAMNESKSGQYVTQSKVATGTIEIGKAALIAMGNLYEGAITAGVTVAKGTAEATAEFVRHKHGEEAGAAADQTVTIIEDMGRTLHNANRLRPKNVLKGGAVHYVKSKYGDKIEVKVGSDGELLPAEPGVPQAALEGGVFVETPAINEELNEGEAMVIQDGRAVIVQDSTNEATEATDATS